MDYQAEPYWKVLDDLRRVAAPASPSREPLSARQLAWREEKELNRLMRRAERAFGLPWPEIWRRYGAAVARRPEA